MKTINYSNRSAINKLLIRQAIDDKLVQRVVVGIVNQVKDKGDKALVNFSEQFDPKPTKNFRVSNVEMRAAYKQVSEEFIRAVKVSAQNQRQFQQSLLFTKSNVVETMPGVKVWREWRSIESVGLYIPGGRARYPSSVIMGVVPARIADCRRIVICTPPDKNGKVPPSTLVAAVELGVTEIYKVGGAQAIAAMAYGTNSIQPVNKIFGAGNAYVTAAKQLVQADIAIDMPAGPSEIMVMADDSAKPAWVAADLLSQCEHGPDSVAVLVTNSKEFAAEASKQIKIQKTQLSTEDTIDYSLKNSAIVLVQNFKQAVELANRYAPEHLEICTQNAKTLKNQIQNAGAILLGNYSPEPAGDYASGSNHVLPTSGFAKSYSGLSVEAFGKWIEVQQLTKSGLDKLNPSIQTLATAEGLPAHARSVSMRFDESTKKVAFIDRDGTLIFEPPDTFQIDSLAKLKILPGVIEGLRKLQKEGYELVIVSNQNGLGTKSFPLRKFELPQQKMLKIFAQHGISFGEIFICPHLPEENCACRKPKTGMVDGYLQKTSIDRTSSFVCGDRESDRQFAAKLQLRFLPAKTNGNFYQAIRKVKELKNG